MKAAWSQLGGAAEVGVGSRAGWYDGEAVGPAMEAMVGGPAGTTTRAVGPTVGCSSDLHQRSRERHKLEQHDRRGPAGKA